VLLFPQLEDADVPPCFPYWDGASCIPPTLEGTNQTKSSGAKIMLALICNYNKSKMAQKS